MKKYDRYINYINAVIRLLLINHNYKHLDIPFTFYFIINHLMSLIMILSHIMYYNKTCIKYLGLLSLSNT